MFNSNCANCQRLKERLEVFFENAPDAYFINDMKGVFIDGNKAAEEMIGYKREELIGKNMLETKLLQLKDVPRVIALLARNALGQKTGPDVFVLNRKDGSQVVAEIRTSPVKIDGKFLEIGLARDITERKRMEQELIQSEKMAAIGKLGTGGAHDMNNPLGSILGYTQLLLDRTSSEDRNHEALKIIEESAERCRRIVEEMLEFSHSSEFEPEPVDINRVIEASLQNVYFEERVKIEIDLEPSLPLVLGNLNQLQRVFINLLLNAKEALNGEGGIRVSSRLDPPENKIEIRFEDEGMGIRPDQIQNIFKPFYTLKDAPGHHGLGLSICRQVVEMHQGRIEVESVADKGTTFKIRLPVSKPPL